MPVLAFLGRRLAIFAISLVGASMLIFAVCSALPGEVAEIILGEGASQAQIEALTAELGLDRPPVVRYLEWVGGMLHGDFGVSYFTGQSVSGLMAPRIAVTLWLVLFALLLSVAVALPVGMLAAMKRRSWQGFAATAVAQLGMAVPAFWAAIVLVLVFAVGLRWLPANGYIPLTTDPVSWAAHLVLPVTSLAIVQSAVLVRYVRSAFIEVLSEDYYRTARAVGWRPFPALLRHGLRNAALSLVTVVGLQLASVLVGAIVIEQVFALPGLGSQLLSAVSQRDLMIVQGVVMFLAASVLLINFLVDLSYAWIDPRLRTEAER
ncbi:ABC transporter permease [Micropruina sonneratiae]|uniref:ABC transporter permease n=1 Tax=Micropruina sonneratiae TaxID=2986940 RepID=UPI0022269983|nr:ABC transporter permease [Micropruina sp. KQZ13P-5]MCW3157502.1 ABC transporter permease [Micropruina sp. KQZ13P-5]